MTLRVALALAVATAAAGSAAPPAGAGCPRGTLRPLAGAPTQQERAGSAYAAIRFARAYAARAGLVTLRMSVSEVRWARTWPPVSFVLSACGERTAAATVAVGIVFPVMYAEPARPPPGCRFCAAVVLLVARGPRGWFVWDAL